MKKRIFIAAVFCGMLSGCATDYYKFSESGEKNFNVAHAKCKAVEKRAMSSPQQQIISAINPQGFGAFMAGDAAYEACMIELGWAPCKDAPISENICN